MAGLFWQAVPRDEWPDDAESQAAILAQFHGPFGDCRQELVFIGQQLDQAALRQQLQDAPGKDDFIADLALQQRPGAAATAS